MCGRDWSPSIKDPAFELPDSGPGCRDLHVNDGGGDSLAIETSYHSIIGCLTSIDVVFTVGMARFVESPSIGQIQRVRLPTCPGSRFCVELWSMLDVLAFHRSASAGMPGFGSSIVDPRFHISGGRRSVAPRGFVCLFARIPLPLSHPTCTTSTIPQVLNIVSLLAVLVALLSGSVMGQSYGSRRSLSQYGGRKLSQYNGRRLNQYRKKRVLSQY